jgi:hypothetical protein
VTGSNFKPALLTRTEIEWLLNKVNITKAYQYRIKSDIKKKLKTFTELEIPLLIQKGFIDAKSLSKYNQNLMANSQMNNQNYPIDSSNGEICGQNMVGRKGCVTILVLRVGSGINVTYKALKFS